MKKQKKFYILLGSKYLNKDGSFVTDTISENTLVFDSLEEARSHAESHDQKESLRIKHKEIIEEQE